MSDVERMLREELADLAALPQPEPAAMLGRIRRARHRGAAFLGAVLGVLIITAGAVVWLARPSAPPVTAMPDGLRVPGLASVYFADSDHGFVPLVHCQDVCEAWLGSTTDGGRSWQAHPVPGLEGPANGWEPSVQMRVLDSRTVALDDYSGEKRWFTTDAGRTWSELSQAPQGTIAQIPPAGLAQIQTNAANPIGIKVLRPDGTTAMLASAPHVAISSARTEVLFGTDGSAWIQGAGDERSYLYVSRDRGRTWAPVPLPADSDRPGALVLMPSSGHLTTHDGVNAYLIDRFGFRAWHTNDDGRNWQPLDVPFAKPTQDVGLVGEAQPDGALAVFDIVGNQAYRFGPGEDAALPIEGRPLGLAGARYVRRDGPEPNGPFHHSLDAITWTKVPFDPR